MAGFAYPLHPIYALLFVDKEVSAVHFQIFCLGEAETLGLERDPRGQAGEAV